MECVVVGDKKILGELMVGLFIVNLLISELLKNWGEGGRGELVCKGFFGEWMI